MKNNFILLYLFVIMQAPVSGAELFSLKGDAGTGGELMYDYNSSPESNAGAKASAAANGSSACFFYNPALMSRQAYKKAGIFYELNGQNVKINSVSALYPGFGGNSFGFGYQGVSTNDIEKTNSAGEVLGSAGYSESFYDVAYSRIFSKKVSAGLALKILNRTLTDSSFTGYGVDLGISILPTFATPFDLGISAVNIFSTKLNRDNYPQVIKAGLSRAIGQSLSVSIDYGLELGNNRQLSALGIKYFILTGRNEFSMSAGYDLKELSFGFDFTVYNFRLGYSAGFSSLGIGHRMGLSYVIGLSPQAQELVNAEEKRKLAAERKVNDKIIEAMNLMLNKNRKRAEDLLKEAVLLAPENTRTKSLISDLITDTMRFDVKEFERNIAELYTSGKYFEAREKVTELLSKEPKSAAGQKYLVLTDFQIHLAEGNFFAAKSDLEHALENDPANNELKKLYSKLATAIDFLKRDVK